MIRNLRRFAFMVSDVEAGRRFHETFGPEGEARGN
jgi:hypothetical protein